MNAHYDSVISAGFHIPELLLTTGMDLPTSVKLLKITPSQIYPEGFFAGDPKFRQVNS